MGHEMPGLGGIPLAGGGSDRDGLDLDVLHVIFGPVMPHWPAGLVLRCSVQGDVVVEAEAAVVGVDEQVASRHRDAPREPRRVALSRCDAMARLLAVAGWERAAGRARDVRDALLDDVPLADCSAPLSRLERQVCGSVLLRWSLRGLPAAAAQGAGEPDVMGQLRRWMREARGAVEGTVPVEPHPGTPPLESLGALVTGLELASVRLAVAASGVDTTTVARHEVAHG